MHKRPHPPARDPNPGYRHRQRGLPRSRSLQTLHGAAPDVPSWAGQGARWAQREAELCRQVQDRGPRASGWAPLGYRAERNEQPVDHKPPQGGRQEDTSMGGHGSAAKRRAVGGGSRSPGPAPRQSRRHRGRADLLGEGSRTNSWAAAVSASPCPWTPGGLWAWSSARPRDQKRARRPHGALTASDRSHLSHPIKGILLRPCRRPPQPQAQLRHQPARVTPPPVSPPTRHMTARPLHLLL